MLIFAKEQSLVKMTKWLICFHAEGHRKCKFLKEKYFLGQCVYWTNCIAKTDKLLNASFFISSK